MNVTPKVGGDQEIGVSFLIVLAETSSAELLCLSVINFSEPLEVELFGLLYCLFDLLYFVVGQFCVLFRQFGFLLGHTDARLHRVRVVLVGVDSRPVIFECLCTQRWVRSFS